MLQVLLGTLLVCAAVHIFVHLSEHFAECFRSCCATLENWRGPLGYTGPWAKSILS